MSIKVVDLPFVGHPVTDVARARKFYEEILGLHAALAVPLHDGQWWIEYSFPGGTLAISNAWPPAGGGATTALEVEDLDAALAHCKAAGVTITFETMDTPVCRFFGVKDPDGNDVLLHKQKPHKTC